jgi:hypothetical protein
MAFPKSYSKGKQLEQSCLFQTHKACKHRPRNTKAMLAFVRCAHIFN